MFERFTKEARRAVTAAVSEAERRGDSHVGTEHLLAGLASSAPRGRDMLDNKIDEIREAWDVMDSTALKATGIELDPALETARSPSQKGGHLPFTSGAKEVLRDTLREAINLDSRRIEPEHMMIALTLRPARDPAIRLLQGAGASPDALRSKVLRSLRQSA